jgi:antitoxin component YwqK of YwqJK toxin-antitoxin module
MKTLILNVERLTREQDSVGDALWEGSYFSGIAFEEDAATGTVVAVTGYRFGKLHGAAREWDTAGWLIEEEYNDQGGNHGPIRKWYPNGQLAESAHSEHSIDMRSAIRVR